MAARPTTRMKPRPKRRIIAAQQTSQTMGPLGGYKRSPFVQPSHTHMSNTHTHTRTETETERERDERQGWHACASHPDSSLFERTHQPHTRTHACVGRHS
mmetsp:Transcript_27378/g.68329  ORF Transcript_27378/g.68329 Transcript_27378/m.68329 type:complete len:100 (+) Transcript_27378:1143-1442(+)